MYTFRRDENYVFVRQNGDAKREYKVFFSLVIQRYVCSCPDFQYRKLQTGGNCKHIIAMMKYDMGKRGSEHVAIGAVQSTGNRTETDKEQ